MNYNQLKYHDQARELAKLLDDDQSEWREYACKEYDADDKSKLNSEKKLLRQHVQARANRMLEILNEIGEPSIKNIGTDGALAISVLATHTSLEVTRRILEAFNNLYAHDKTSVRKESIPAMTDWVAILEHRMQKFGTIWLLDAKGYPFLPTVADFDNIDDIRAEYGVEPLRWPKSLAIPAEKQSWLARPLSELTMRDPTDEEYTAFETDYLT